MSSYRVTGKQKVAKNFSCSFICWLQDSVMLMKTACHVNRVFQYAGIFPFQIFIY